MPNHTDHSDRGRSTAKPLALGYLRAHLMMTEIELDRARHGREVFAWHSSYSLGSVFIEQMIGAPAAFDGLITAVQAQKAGGDRVAGSAPSRDGR